MTRKRSLTTARVKAAVGIRKPIDTANYTFEDDVYNQNNTEISNIAPSAISAPTPATTNREKAPVNVMNNSKFADAFRQARNAGYSTFMWRGKEYGTKYKNEVTKTPDTKSIASGSNTNRKAVSKTNGTATIYNKSFAGAFREARTRGLSKFRWNGKTYGTKVGSPTSTSKSASTSNSSSSSSSSSNSSTKSTNVNTNSVTNNGYNRNSGMVSIYDWSDAPKGMDYYAFKDWYKKNSNRKWIRDTEIGNAYNDYDYKTRVEPSYRYDGPVPVNYNNKNAGTLSKAYGI